MGQKTTIGEVRKLVRKLVLEASNIPHYSCPKCKAAAKRTTEGSHTAYTCTKCEWRGNKPIEEAAVRNARALNESEVYFFRDDHGDMKYSDDEGNEGPADESAPEGSTLTYSQAKQYMGTGGGRGSGMYAQVGGSMPDYSHGNRYPSTSRFGGHKRSWRR